jgi:hypothetical protein
MRIAANEESTAGLVSLSNTRVFDLESGTFRAIHRPEAPRFGAFWRRAGEGQGKGVGSGS